MCIEGGLVVEPHNHVCDIWVQVRVLINPEMNVIIRPNMQAVFKLFPGRQKLLLMIFYHIRMFMAILVLYFRLLCPAIPHLAHPTLCCG